MEISLFFFITSKYGYVGFLKNQKIVSRKHFEINNDLSEKITNICNDLVSSNNIQWKDISFVYSNLEPGRHTITRIMAVFLRMILIMNKNIGIYLIDTLEFLASNREVVVCAFITKKQLDFAYFKQSKEIEFTHRIELEELEKKMNTKYKNLKLIENLKINEIEEHFFELKNKFELTKFKDIKPKEFKII